MVATSSVRARQFRFLCKILKFLKITAFPVVRHGRLAECYVIDLSAAKGYAYPLFAPDFYKIALEMI